MSKEKSIKIIKGIIEDLKDDMLSTKNDRFVINEDIEKVEALLDILNLINRQQNEI